jgi:hypothetical protein
LFGFAHLGENRVLAGAVPKQIISIPDNRIEIASCKALMEHLDLMLSFSFIFLDRSKVTQLV